MSVQKKFASLIVTFALFAVLLVAPAAQAQEMTETPVVCDSTLVTLLLVAEHDYDYLSDMMMMDSSHMPNVDMGQFKPLIDSIIAMMTAMPAMTDDQMQMMATEESQASEMMSMSDGALMQMWMKSMNMPEDDMPMNSVLTAGDVAGEDPACSALRQDVQHFLLVHIVADMMHSGM